MAAPLYLTKGELRGKLLTRLGYGGIGAAAGMFMPMVDDLLEEAQEQLYEIFTDEKGVREWEIKTNPGQRWYDIPDTCDIDHIVGVWSQQNGEYWRPLTRGINPSHDSDYDDIEDYPYRYDIRVPSGSDMGVELQENGDMSIDDSSAEGEQGFSFSPPNSWEIREGKARKVGGNTSWLRSNVAFVAGDSYEISYEISEEPADSVYVSGKNISGLVGKHSFSFTATIPSLLQFISFSGVFGVNVDNVSIKTTSVSAIADTTVTKIEIWPKPDDVYPMKIEGPMVVRPFVKDGDRASFDSRLILLYAIAFGKAHLNKPDAKSAMDAWKTRLLRIKANQHGTREYVRKNPNTPEVEMRPRPKVI